MSQSNTLGFLELNSSVEGIENVNYILKVADSQLGILNHGDGLHQSNKLV